MPYTYLLELVASSALATTCFICSRLLWIAQAKRASRSTRLLGMASLFCGITTVVALASSIFLVHPTDGIPLLNPWIGLMYLCLHTVMVVYPISAVKEDWLTSKHFFFLFLPSLVLAIVFLFFQGRWTPLYTWEDFVNNLGRADVLVRAFSQLLIIPYCFIPFIVPYNYLRSSASARWINTYSFFLLGLCLIHIVVMFTGIPVLMILVSLLSAVFYLSATHYEMEDRLYPAAEGHPAGSESRTRKTEEPEESLPVEEEIWERVCRVMDVQQAWKDPNLTLIGMARLCATNTTYLLRAIREHTDGAGFKELLNSKRVAAVAAQIKDNPDTDVQTAFFNAGYRSRITAWRNFKEITGMSPAEYRQSLTKQ